MTTKRWKASADDKLQVLAGRTTIVYHFSLRWLTGIEPVLYASLQVSKVLGSKKQSLFLSQNYILKTKAFTPWLLIKLIIYRTIAISAGYTVLLKNKICCECRAVTIPLKLSYFQSIPYKLCVGVYWLGSQDLILTTILSSAKSLKLGYSIDISHAQEYVGTYFPGTLRKIILPNNFFDAVSAPFWM